MPPGVKAVIETVRVVELVPLEASLTLAEFRDGTKPVTVGVNEAESATVPEKPCRLPKLITDCPLEPPLVLAKRL